MPKLVLIEWEDSHKTDGWCIGHNPPCESVPIKSIGWIIAENSKAIVITAHKSKEAEPQYCNAMTIPKCSITKITRVKS
ncbi:MAG: hypothetical protein A2017_06505 [Lentisphaerae bacterium GWF2_44_16]|nr:MAG: hypothetical protein A2017_06505 [Lentisphaerae bacterium GWF2_44_16]